MAATEPKSEPQAKERVFQKEVYLHTSPHLKAEPDPATAMAAESLHFSFGTLSSWELEAWYEDLQEVLSSDENGGTYGSPPGNEEVRILHLKLGGNVALPFSINSAYLFSFP